MAIIKGKSNDEWRDKRSQEQLAIGGLPLNAEWRLRTLREGRKFFTSNLSVSEFALARAERITPLGQVTGSCIYHIGWQPTPVYSSMELTLLSHAHNEAWRLALSRLQTEAQALGAHGIVGVHLEPKMYEWGANLLEISAQGTAIRWDGVPVSSAPFLSAVSGQEFWALLSAGYRPVGIAYGTCVYYQVTSNQTRWATQGGLLNSAARMNQEVTEYTKGFYNARHHAMQRMEMEATRVGAEGIVGVQVEKHLALHEVEVEINETKYQRNDLIARFSAIGTAIAPYMDYQPVIHYALPLTD